jgi:hypothetical protein
LLAGGIDLLARPDSLRIEVTYFTVAFLLDERAFNTGGTG